MFVCIYYNYEFCGEKGYLLIYQLMFSLALLHCLYFKCMQKWAPDNIYLFSLKSTNLSSSYHSQQVFKYFLHQNHPLVVVEQSHLIGQTDNRRYWLECCSFSKRSKSLRSWFRSWKALLIQGLDLTSLELYWPVNTFLKDHLTQSYT